jgi:alkaline phosphatase
MNRKRLVVTQDFASTMRRGHLNVIRMAFVLSLSAVFNCCTLATIDAQNVSATTSVADPDSLDFPKKVQLEAIEAGRSPFGYWGTNPAENTGWKSHSNRLIPVYTFGTKGAGAGVDLKSWTRENSPYRNPEAVQKLYGYLPDHTVNEDADWMDQTNIYDIQKTAAAAGKKHIFLVVFDGMDWQTTRAAAIWNQKKVTYTEGRGKGTHFQEYQASGTSQFGYMVTSAHNEGTDVDVDAQTVKNPGGTIRGGYDARLAGLTPWSIPLDPGYLIAKPAEGHSKHNYTDSSSSATSMTAGIKTFNGGVNVDATGAPVSTIAHQLQQQGWQVGAISSVPISHATPAAAYAHNVSRDDYQDLTRDMVGLPSIMHPTNPLTGLDVLIGGGYGNTGDPKDDLKKQGKNYVQGNVYLTDADLKAIDVREGGKYSVAVRTAGLDGTDVLTKAVDEAVKGNHRLFGFFGNGSFNGHLPFATADGRFDPIRGQAKKFETYTPSDLLENPTLGEMTSAALRYLDRKDTPFWLMVESGDVDWANHDDNIDNSIGAVNAGDQAVRVIAGWVEANSNWSESLLIVTADHGHMLNITQPELLYSVPQPALIPEEKAAEKPADAAAAAEPQK